MLPAEQKAKEIPARDGLDLLPQPLDRIAMNAREQRAIAPFGLCGVRRVNEPLMIDAFGNERGQRGLDLVARQPHRGGQSRGS